MKRLLTTMYCLYFSERIVYTLVMIWIFLVIGSCIMLVTSSIFPLSGLMIFCFLSGVILLVMIPWLMINLKFNSFLSNLNLAMVPHWRQFVIIATLSFIILFSGLLTWAMSFSKKEIAGHSMEIFWVLFCISSLMVFISKYAFRNLLILWSFMLLILLLLYSGLSKFLFLQIQAIESTVMIIMMLVTSLIIWSLIILSPDHTNKINTNRFSKYIFSKYLSNGLDDPSQLSVIKTLITGHIVTKSFWAKVRTKFFSIVVLSTLILVVFYNTLLNLTINGVNILMTIGFVSFIHMSSHSESLARLRLLWLKLPGNRQQFWLLWKNHLHSDIYLTSLLQVLLGALVYKFFDISNVMIILFATIIFVCIPSMNYCTTWFQLTRYNNFLVGIISMVIYGIGIGLVNFALYQELYGPIMLLGAYSGTVGLLCYFGVKKTFLTLDWMVIKPKLGTLNFLGF